MLLHDVILKYINNFTYDPRSHSGGRHKQNSKILKLSSLTPLVVDTVPIAVMGPILMQLSTLCYILGIIPVPLVSSIEGRRILLSK